MKYTSSYIATNMISLENQSIKNWLDALGKFVYLISQEDDKITEQIVTLINNMLETWQ